MNNKNKDVTEKTKSIAELQARIAMLDLDDSREAQAEKRKLQEVVDGKVLAAQKEYQDALLSGDEEAAAAAVVKMSEAQVAWANAGWSNEAVNLYMQDFFDKFTEQSKNYQFEVELKAILADPDDTFGNYIKDTVDKFKDENGKVDLYEVLNTGIEYDQNPNKNSRRHTLPDDQQAYVGLKFAADEYGVSVEQLLPPVASASTFSRAASNSVIALVTF